MELQELALRIRSGDRDALKTLISEYGVGVYQKAYRKTQDKTLAREATRQTFAQLVTALQEQTDMDGWELWLNALAKKNIDTYANIGADMAYLERELDSELFAQKSLPEAQTAAFAARQQAMQRQAQAHAQYELEAERQAAERAKLTAQLAAQFAAERQAAEQAQMAQLAAKQLAERQAAEQAQMAQLAAKRQTEAQFKPMQPAAQPPAPAELPERAQGDARPNPHKRHGRKGDALFPEKRKRTAWPAVVALILLCAALLWLLLGVTMSMGWLPKLDLGYDWFNAHVLDLF